jgi:hypothetical protein
VFEELEILCLEGLLCGLGNKHKKLRIIFLAFGITFFRFLLAVEPV